MACWARMRLALVLTVAVALILPAFQPTSSPTASAAGADYFPETGHTLSGPIRSTWQANGGVWLFGYPISEPMRWSTEQGGTVIAQYFERARLEYHPEHEGTQYRVLGGLLGIDLTQGRETEPAFVPVQALGSDDCAYHLETGHNLCSHFLRWWASEGGLPIFGHPISEPFKEDGFEVQYFERARLEHHPEHAGTEWEVALGHLGTLDAARRGLTDVESFAPIDAPTVQTRVDTPLRADAAGGEVLQTLTSGTTVAVIGGPSWDAYRVFAGDTAGWVRAGDLTWSETADPRTATTLPLWMADPTIDARSAEISDFVSIAIYDPRTNQLFEGGTSGPVAAASLSKVLLLAIALKQSEQRGEAVNASNTGTLTLMIELSDNDAANDIWGVIGGRPGVETFLSDNRLTGFAIPHAFDWGAIEATAGSWATFFGLLGSGQLLNPANTSYALGLLHDVIGQHRFGATTPGDNRLSIGKNGWYEDFDPSYWWRVNSAALVDSVEGPPGVAPLAVVSLTHYLGEYTMDLGASVGAEVQAAAVRYAATRWAEFHAQADQPTRATLTAQGGSIVTLADIAAGLSHELLVWEQ